jgi:glycosyltransferase involved in cell wall biosynthesis
VNFGYNRGTKNDELISVITSTYNCEQFLPEAIESVLGQTIDNLEYFIIDDGSTDDTRKVVESYLNDKRIRYHYQENRGQSAGKNVGLALSKGDYICYLDADDRWELDKLQAQLEIFQKYEDVSIVYGDINFIDEKGGYLNLPNMKRYTGFITEKLVIENFVSFNTAMFRKRCYEELGGFDESLRYSPDYDLWLRYSTRHKFYYHPKIMSNHRIWGNQMSQKRDERFEAVYIIKKRFFEKYPDAVGEGARKKSWAHYYTRKGKYLVSRSDYRRALIDYAKALKYYPANIETWKALLKMAILQK